MTAIFSDIANMFMYFKICLFYFVDVQNLLGCYEFVYNRARLDLCICIVNIRKNNKNYKIFFHGHPYLIKSLVVYFDLSNKFV